MSESLQPFGAYCLEARKHSPLRHVPLPVAERDNIKWPPESVLPDVVEVVAMRMGVKAGDIYGRSQKRPFTNARHMVSLIMRERMRLSHAGIGRLMGRDHSTIIKGVLRAQALRHHDIGFRRQHAEVTRTLEARGWCFPYGDEEGT